MEESQFEKLNKLFENLNLQSDNWKLNLFKLVEDKIDSNLILEMVEHLATLYSTLLDR